MSPLDDRQKNHTLTLNSSPPSAVLFVRRMSYDTIYPQLKDCIPSIARVVEEYAKNPTQELEVRLGTLTQGRFESHVSNAFMNAVISLLDTNPIDTWDTSWEQMHDYFYTHRGTPIRTRVTFDTQNLAIRTHHIHKKNVSTHSYTSSCSDTPDLRVSLAQETVIPPEQLPNQVLPTFVRLRQRKSYFIGPSRESPTWRFDFTMSWDDSTRDGAERKQKTGQPIYEIECELVDPSYVRSRSYEHVAVSMLLKITDLLEKDGVGFSPSPN